jgi:ribokinase
MDGPLDVAGLGYCSYDILAIAPGLPEFDSVHGVHLAGLAYDGGGPASTALVTLARLGARVGYIGTLGDDLEGHWLGEQLAQERVDLCRLRVRSDVGTNVCLILVEQGTGRRAILCRSRVHATDLLLDEDDRAYIQSARVLHLDGQFMPAALQAARWAQEAGVKVCFDGNHVRPGLGELLPLVDWLVVAQPFPRDSTGLAEEEAAARNLLELGAEILVVTQGKRGCQMWTPGATFQVPGFHVEAIDSTGAGDAFHGAFIYAMLQGWDLRQVARFANAVAAINCRTLGGQRGLPALADAKAFLETRSSSAP